MSERGQPDMNLLRAHVDDASEESLSHAYDLGREALEQGLGLLDVLASYQAMVETLVLPAPDDQRRHVAEAVSDYFREFLSPFEMMFRGYQEANLQLQRLNRELAAANLELRDKQAQLIQAAKMASLGELVAGVAHEINNPLSFVCSHVTTTLGSLDKIEAELGSERSPAAAEHLARAQRRLRHADTGLERIRELVVKLRVFSRLDEGERKTVKISECVDSVLTILQHKLRGRIEVTVQYGEPDSVDCYPSLLNQALMNLVANSIDAIDGPGTVSISTGADAVASDLP